LFLGSSDNAVLWHFWRRVGWWNCVPIFSLAQQNSLIPEAFFFFGVPGEIPAGGTDFIMLSVPQFLHQCSSVIFHKNGGLVEVEAWNYVPINKGYKKITFFNPQFLKQCSSVVFLKKGRARGTVYLAGETNTL
jgi:hypothetical protein